MPLTLLTGFGPTNGSTTTVPTAPTASISPSPPQTPYPNAFLFQPVSVDSGMFASPTSTPVPAIPATPTPNVDIENEPPPA